MSAFNPKRSTNERVHSRCAENIGLDASLSDAPNTFLTFTIPIIAHHTSLPIVSSLIHFPAPSPLLLLEVSPVPAPAPDPPSRSTLTQVHPAHLFHLLLSSSTPNQIRNVISAKCSPPTTYHPLLWIVISRLIDTLARTESNAQTQLLCTYYRYEKSIMR